LVSGLGQVLAAFDLRAPWLLNETGTGFVSIVKRTRLCLDCYCFSTVQWSLLVFGFGFGLICVSVSLSRRNLSSFLWFRFLFFFFCSLFCLNLWSFSEWTERNSVDVLGVGFSFSSVVDLAEIATANDFSNGSIAINTESNGMRKKEFKPKNQMSIRF